MGSEAQILPAHLEFYRFCEEHLRKHNLWETSGAILFSKGSTLQLGDLYVLGFNPGGEGDDYSSIGEHLQGQLSQNSKTEFSGDEWCSPYQCRLKTLLTKRLSYKLEEVCISNLIIEISQDESKVDYCWKTKDKIIRQYKIDKIK